MAKKVVGLDPDQILHARQRALELACSPVTYGINGPMLPATEDVVKRANAYATFLVAPWMKDDPAEAESTETCGA